MKRPALLFLAFVFCACSAFAQSFTGSITWGAPFNWNVTPQSYSVDSGTGVITFSLSNTDGYGSGWIEIREERLDANGNVVSANNVQYNHGVNPVFVGLDPGTHSAVRLTPRDNSAAAGATGEILLAASAATTYSVTFNIPAQEYGVSYYEFRQNGNLVGEFMQNQHSPATTYTVSGLQSPDKVTMYRLEGAHQSVKHPDGSLIPIGFVQTGQTAVADGNPSEGGTTVAAPATPEVQSADIIVPETLPPIDPAAILTPTAAPTAQTPVGTVTSPTAPTLVTPSGTEGAKKEDIEANTNRLVTAVHETSTKATESSNALITAVNKLLTAQNEGDAKVIEAVDKVSGAVISTGNKQLEQGKRIEDAVRKSGLDVLAQAIEANKRADKMIEELRSQKGATDGVKGSVDTVAGKVDGVKGSVDAVKSAVDSLKSSQDTKDTAAKQAADEATANAATQGAAARAAAESSVGQGVPTLGGAGSGPSAGGSWVVAWPGVASFDLDPASDETVVSLAQFVKTVCTWVVLGLYAWWLWSEFRGLAQTSVLLQQAKGNTVAAGTGGQATALAAAGLISAALLGLPAAFFGLNPLGLSGLDSNPMEGASGLLGRSVYLLYFVLPVPTIITVLAGMFIVRKGGLVILMGTAAAVRFIVP